ncbi:MAG: type II secretion system major pseudopilin GspG [Verrucomicrobiota bacterium]
MPEQSESYDGDSRVEEVGLVITFAIIGSAVAVLIGFGSQMFGTTGSPPEERTKLSIMRATVALRNYQLDNAKFPTQEQGLRALIEKPTLEPVPDRWKQYIDPLPLDPFGQELKYVIPSQRSEAEFDVYSVGKDGADGTDDDIGNWNL